jgi:phage shock protein A
MDGPDDGGLILAQELLLLKDEIEHRRHALAALLAANHQLEARAAEADARVHELEAAARATYPPAAPQVQE